MIASDKTASDMIASDMGRADRAWAKGRLLSGRALPALRSGPLLGGPLLGGPFLGGLLRCLVLAAVGVAAVMAAPSQALAQHVVLKVNGEVITDYDIEQRTKFNIMASHKTPPRKDVIEELIDDKLKAQIARRYKIDLTDKDVDAQFADMAKRMHLTADQLTKLLGQGGVDAKTLKAKILADLSWQAIVFGRYQASLTVSEASINEELKKGGDNKGGNNKGESEVGYDYTLRAILFLVPEGNAGMREARHKEAEALRARFTSCDTGLSEARAQHEVIIRETITKNSSDLPAVLRDILNKTEIGHLTPPEVTQQGIEMYAMCDKKETRVDTPARKDARNRIRSRLFEARSATFLRELRREAMIERMP